VILPIFYRDFNTSLHVTLLLAVANCSVLEDGAEKSQFEVTRDRNVSTPAFPVSPLGIQQQQQQMPGDQRLARTTEVEDIPQQLSVRPPQDVVLSYQR